MDGTSATLGSIVKESVKECEVVHTSEKIDLAEPMASRSRVSLRSAAPLRAARDDDEDGDPRYPPKRKIEQFARGRVDTMRVLEYH